MSGVVATILAVVALPVNIIGLAIPFWDYYGTFVGSTYSGIWQRCFSFDGYSACVGFGFFETNSLKAVRAMEILGMLTLGLAILFGVIKLCSKRDKLAFFVAAGMLAIVAGCLMIIGCVIYAAKTRDEVTAPKQRGLHAGFGLCIVAGILSIISRILYLVDRRRNMNSQPGQIVTVAQPGPEPYHVPYGPGSVYAVGNPGIVITSPPTGGYTVATYSTGSTGANVPMAYNH